MNEQEKRIAETQARQAKEDLAGAIAATTPMPGPLRKAFVEQNFIQVGQYRVRPVCDRDFEFLQALNNPMHRLIDDQKADLPTRGPAVWELAYLLTRELKESKEIFRQDKGAETFKEKAADEFGEYQAGEIVQLFKACVQQIMEYWKTALTHIEDKATSEGEAGAVQENP